MDIQALLLMLITWLGFSLDRQTLDFTCFWEIYLYK